MRTYSTHAPESYPQLDVVHVLNPCVPAASFSCAPCAAYFVTGQGVKVTIASLKKNSPPGKCCVPYPQSPTPYIMYSGSKDIYFSMDTSCNSLISTSAYPTSFKAVWVCGCTKNDCAPMKGLSTTIGGEQNFGFVGFNKPWTSYLLQCDHLVGAKIAMLVVPLEWGLMPRVAKGQDVQKRGFV